MLFKWLDASEAAQVGATLAEDFFVQTSGPSGARRKEASRPQGQELQKFLQKFLQQVDRAAQPIKLNFFKRAKLANSFKWRLLDKGVDKELVEELTQALVLRLTAGRGTEARVPGTASPGRRNSRNVAALLAQANEHMSRGAYAEAIGCLQDLLELDRRHAVAHNNLGAALCHVGRYAEAEDQFRQAINARGSYPEGHCNLGTVLRWRGRVSESEGPLRRALKLKPTYVDAQVNLSATLVLLGRLGEARNLLEKALKLAPRNVAALVGLGQIAGPEGRLEEAESLFRRALDIDPSADGAWAGLAWLRRMTPADSGWVKRAEGLAAHGLAPLSEANIRYAIGKYWDDVGDFGRAFRAYQRANELQKMAAESYKREARTRFVDDMIRVYTRQTLSRPPAGASDSARPVFVVGMPRSGTSLVEQIIASHPAARGAGELGFWSEAMRRHEGAIRNEPIGGPLAGRLSAAYLRVLAQHSPDALRVVDKATFNSEYLGVIHLVFPRARFIYLRRDPVDTCLSCYFQQLSQEMSFTMDLSDLAHYCGEHRRLMVHWREALPPGVLLDVPYEKLIADQETWTRRMLEFVGLEWDARCLDFHKTERTVSTASFWQVRQKLYQSSVGRWRNYQKFIGPLLELQGLE